MKKGGRLLVHLDESSVVSASQVRESVAVSSTLQTSVSAGQIRTQLQGWPGEERATGYTLGERLSALGLKSLLLWEEYPGVSFEQTKEGLQRFAATGITMGN